MIIDTPWMPNVLGGGDVAGPASATDNAVARFDGTTGKLIQNSVVTIADTTGAIAGAQSLTSPAASNLTLGTGTSGAAVTVLSASNNVGVGNVTPVQKLDVAGVSGGPAASGTSADGSLRLLAGSFNMVLDMGVNHAVSSWIQSRDRTNYITNYDLALQPNGGNVGIGTTTLTGLSGSGGLKINSSTAGSSGAGALVIAGGLATGAASYFGAAVTAAPEGYSVNASGTYGMSLCQIDNSLNRLGLTAGVSISGSDYIARYASPMFVRMAPDVGVFQICVDSGKTIGNIYTPTGQLSISSTTATFTGTVIAPAATASLAPLRIPHGTAPTSPTNGDMWTTTAGLYIRINGATVGPLS